MEPKIRAQLLNGIVMDADVASGNRVQVALAAKMVELQNSCTASGYGDQFCAAGLNSAARTWFAEKTSSGMSVISMVHLFLGLRFGGVKK